MENSSATVKASNSSDEDDTPPLSPDVDEFEQDLDTHRHSLEVQEGKKPERPICFDTPIEDVASDNGWAERLEDNDNDCWRFFRAALRKGTIHPFLEDDGDYQWKIWHRYIDREDERRKHCKALEFEAHSKDVTWLYLAEMKARDVYHWQLEVFRMVGDNVQDYLGAIADHRKDSFYSAKNRGLGWYLKRSRISS
ncbi:hypothetical protein PM082_004719 [Marasmius tenuissimus]|nr:hypothetical protein PM082_004719 [Marasmius tenuissimus]